MSITGIVIFAVTYVLVSARRSGRLGLDRPAAALLGAVACVAFGVLTPEQAIRGVDGSTLLLLLGVMGMGAFLVVDDFFGYLEAHLTGWARSPARLLGGIVWGSGLLAAFITNDAVCVLGAPLVVRLIQRHHLPATPFLLALATGANTGSVATLVGNPQNMLCGLLGGLAYVDYLVLMAPVAVVGLAINHAVLSLAFRGQLGGGLAQATESTPVLGVRNIATLVVIFATALVYMTGAPLDWTAAGGFVGLMLLHRRKAEEVWANIDWSLLLFFAGLFVVVEGFRESGAPAWFFAQWPLSAAGDGFAGGAWLAAIFLFGSNVVSNVPFILLIREQVATLSDPQLGWELLAMASTFAGNLTLLGSAANVIVAESGRDVGGFGFVEHIKVGAPIALITTAVGTLWVLALRL